MNQLPAELVLEIVQWTPLHPQLVTLAQVSHTVHDMVRFRLQERSLSDCCVLHRTFRQWKHYRRGSNRISSWSRTIYHPDERFIF